MSSSQGLLLWDRLDTEIPLARIARQDGIRRLFIMGRILDERHSSRSGAERKAIPEPGELVPEISDAANCVSEECRSPSGYPRSHALLFPGGLRCASPTTP